MRLTKILEHFDLSTAAPLARDIEIQGVRPLSEAGEGDLSFLSNPKYRDQAVGSKASAILVSQAVEGADAVQILCKDPYVALARILNLLFPEQPLPSTVHPTAVVAPDAKIGEACHIGPFCVVESGCSIGAGTALVSHVSLGRDSEIGENSKLFPQVVVYPNTRIGNRVRIHAATVIGSDGFGYAQNQGIHMKVPQLAGVRIEDDVEIGSNVSIDRGALSDTVIGSGTKIDNMVQIGHGVKIGNHSILVSQTGISGSSSVGTHTILAGKVGVVGHVSIGDRIVVMGDSVVTRNLDKPGQYAGNPAIPHMQYQRQLAHVRKLPKLQERVKSLEKALKNE